MAFPTGKDFEPPDKYLTEVGRIALEWSHLEYKLQNAVCEVIGLKWDGDRRAALATHLAFQTQIDIIGAYIRARNLEKAFIDEWSLLANEMDEQRRWRNLTIHGEWWALHPEKQHVVHTTARRKGVKRTHYDATFEGLLETGNDIKKLRVKLEDWMSRIPFEAHP